MWAVVNVQYAPKSPVSVSAIKVKVDAAILLTSVTVGRSSPFLEPLSPQVDIPQSLGRMASSMPDRRLPSQPQSTVTALWLVLISFPVPLRVGG